MDLITRNVAFARTLPRNPSAAEKAVLVDSLLEGKRAMDAFRKQTATFLAEEERLLEVRSEALKRQRRSTQIALLLGWLLSLAGPVVAVSLFSLGIAQRLAALAENADRLAL